MFVVSTVKGINLVFNDLNDLETHVSNLLAYAEDCRNRQDNRTQVYGIYASDADPILSDMITKALQEVFTHEG